MKILLAICFLWFIFISWIEIKRDKLRGSFLVIFVIIGAILAGSGNRFGFDGEIAALIFAAVVVVIVFSVQHFKKKKKEPDKK